MSSLLRPFTFGVRKRRLSPQEQEETPLRVQAYLCGCHKITKATSRFQPHPRKLHRPADKWRVTEWHAMTSDCLDETCFSKAGIDRRRERLEHMLKVTKAAMINDMERYVDAGRKYHTIPIPSLARSTLSPRYTTAHAQFAALRTPWRRDPFFSDYVEGRHLLSLSQKLTSLAPNSIFVLKQAMEWTLLAEFLRSRFHGKITKLVCEVKDLKERYPPMVPKRKRLRKRVGKDHKKKLMWRATGSPLKTVVRGEEVDRRRSLLKKVRPKPKQVDAGRIPARVEDIWTFGLKRAWERRMNLVKGREMSFAGSP